MNFKYQDSHDRQLQVDRYTGYKTNATIEESNPLLVITQINFPSNIKTVHEAIDHALQRSGYRMDWRQSAEAYDIFSELEIPRVHKKLNLMTLKDAVATLAGEAWQLLVDSVNRKLVIQLHNYVPWHTASKSNGNEPIKLSSQSSVPLMTQTRTNRDTIDSFIPMQTKRHNFRHEYSGSPSEQSASGANIADNDVSLNSVAPNKLTANPVHFASDANIADNDVSLNSVAPDEQAANSVHFASSANVADSDVSLNSVAPNEPAANPVRLASDANVADSDAFVNSVTPNELAANRVHSLKAEMSTLDSADLYDEMSNIHRVQYTPGYVESSHTQLSELSEQAPYKGRVAARGLWSVQPVIKAKEGVGSLDEAVIVHYSSISVKELIEILIPEGWAVHYEVSDAILKQKLVSHAESSRRNALFSLFKELNLKALFYPGQAVVLVAEKEPKAFGYGNFPKFKAIDSREIDAPAASISNIPEVSKSQPEVDTILQNAKMIKNLMNEMEPGFK